MQTPSGSTCIAFAGALLIGLGSTHARAQTAPCDPAATSCYITTMPLYNQHNAAFPNNGSMYCGPTSGSMMVQSQVSKPGVVVDAGSWLSQHFTDPPGDPVATILAEGVLMHTDPKKGTTGGDFTNGTAGLAPQFAQATGARSSWPVSRTNAAYEAIVRDQGAATGLLLFTYQRYDTLKNGKHYYTYSARRNGHYVVLNGYSGNALYIFNPLGARRESHTVSLVYNGCNATSCTTLPPLGGSRLSLYQENHYTNALGQLIVNDIFAVQDYQVVAH